MGIAIRVDPASRKSRRIANKVLGLTFAETKAERKRRKKKQRQEREMARLARVADRNRALTNKQWRSAPKSLVRHVRQLSIALSGNPHWFHLPVLNIRALLSSPGALRQEDCWVFKPNELLSSDGFLSRVFTCSQDLITKVRKDLTADTDEISSEDASRIWTERERHRRC